MQTLRQIWELNKRELPFAARLKFWAKDTYVVILQFGPWFDEKNPWPIDLSEHPIGIPFTNDRPNNIFRGQLFAKHFAIPRYDYPEWELLEGIILDRFQKKQVYNLHDYIRFGKYTGWLVQDIINADCKYIAWAIEKSSFTFDKITLQYIVENISDFNSGLAKIAEEKEAAMLRLYEEPDLDFLLKDNREFEIKVVQSRNWEREEIEDVIVENPKPTITPNIDFLINVNNPLPKDRVKTFSNSYINEHLKWSTSDDVQLKALFLKEPSIDKIANIMYRKPKSIKKRIHFLDLQKETKK